MEHINGRNASFFGQTRGRMICASSNQLLFISLNANMMKQWISIKIWKLVVQERGDHHTSVHGLQHWLRVERNGLYLAERNGANKTIVSLFAMFHDCMRVNDGNDEGHGLRGAEFAKSLRKDLTRLSCTVKISKK